MEAALAPTGLDARRKRISVLLGEIIATSMALLKRGVDPGHGADKREALGIVKRITEQAYQSGVT